MNRLLIVKIGRFDWLKLADELVVKKLGLSHRWEEVFRFKRRHIFRSREEESKASVRWEGGREEERKENWEEGKEGREGRERWE